MENKDALLKEIKRLSFLAFVAGIIVGLLVMRAIFMVALGIG